MKTNDFIIAVLSLILKVVVVIFLIVVVYRMAQTAYDYGYRGFEEPPMSTVGREVTVTITKDMSPKKMGELFYSKGLIRDEKLFWLQYYASEFREDLKSGDFILSTAMTVEEMMKAMTEEPVVVQEETQEGELAPIEEDYPEENDGDEE